jgi:plastocyanin
MRRLVILLAVGCTLIPACGRGQDPALGDADVEGPTLTDLTVTAKNTAFAPTTLKSPAGKELTITFKNDDAGVSHSFHLEGGSAGEIKTDVKPGPSTDTVKVTLQVPASYHFQCDVHPDKMKGTIVVVRVDEEKG